MYSDDIRQRRYHRDRRVVVHGVPQHVGAYELREPETRAGEEQRVPIRWRFRHEFHRHHTAAVIDHYRLTERVGELGRDETRGQIEAAAGHVDGLIAH